MSDCWLIWRIASPSPMDGKLRIASRLNVRLQADPILPYGLSNAAMYPTHQSCPKRQPSRLPPHNWWRANQPYFQTFAVCYVNSRAFTLMLQPLTITTAVDLKNAYHLGCLSGCPMGDKEGCSPTTCCGTWDRNLLGFSAFNLFFCFRVSQYCLSPGGIPLYELLLPVIRWTKPLFNQVADWVDDLCLLTTPPSHPYPCPGIAGACAHFRV